MPRFLLPAWTPSRVKPGQLHSSAGLWRRRQGGRWICHGRLSEAQSGHSNALPKGALAATASIGVAARQSATVDRRRSLHRCQGLHAAAARGGTIVGHQGTVLPCPQKRSLHATARRLRDHHFDTLKVVQRLKEEGFGEEQAAAIMRVLSDVIEESIQNLTRTMVAREDQDRAMYTQKVDFAKLRSDLLSADSTELSLTRTAHDRLSNELAKLNSRLRDDITRTQASVRLDLNLEKGRIREESNVQELKIKETNARIEQEVAGLRERLEGIKFTTLQWLMGVCTGTAALILGAWRLLM